LDFINYQIVITKTLKETYVTIENYVYSLSRYWFTKCFKI